MTWFTRLRNWQTDAANGIGIRADYHDSEDDNFASGINASLNAAGLNSPTANIPFAGFKITGAAVGTAASDYATVNQVQTRVTSYAIDASGSDAYAVTFSPAISSYAAGQQFVFMIGTANTGAATLNVNGLGARTIKKGGSSDLSDGDLQVGQLAFIGYDGSNFQLLSTTSGTVDQGGSSLYGVDGGATDAYAATLTPAISAYVTGATFRIKCNTKSTGAATLNLNSLGAKTIKAPYGADLGNQDIAAGQIIEVIYDGTNFQMLSPVFGAVGQNGATVYAADSSGTDAYAVTLVPAVTDLNTGLVIRFSAGTANTGAATLAVNGLAAKAIKKKGTTNDVATGDILANQIIEVIYDGTNFQMISDVDDINNLTQDASPDGAADFIKTWDASASTYKKALLGSISGVAATQADQETGTSTATYVSPGRQQYHQSASKAWASYTVSSATILSSYNITSLTDNATGDTTVTIATDFSSANYSVTACLIEITANVSTAIAVKNGTTPAAGAVTIVTQNNGTRTDAVQAYVAMFGDQ